MYKLIEAIAGAITRGVIKAVWAELRKPRTAVDEELTDEDRDREMLMRGRLDDYLAGLPASPDGDTGPDDAPPSIEANDDSGMA